MVTRDHDRSDSGQFTLVNRLLHLKPWRINHASKSYKGQLVLHFYFGMLVSQHAKSYG